ncbi:hypothetical protein [Solimonas terrae]|uniref:hypothetical protein n=1 Tax=Solimonas terrae TaxID=1396819 RepID=UPI0015835259|nr:hypothetical protein [Solimonas terrae]
MRADGPVASPGTASETAPKAPRCGFLFNHDQLHQIAHSAPIAFELIRRSTQMDVTLLASSQAQLDYLQCAAARYGLAQADIRLLHLPRWLRPIARALDGIMPFSRITMLLGNLATFRTLDLLVVPEKTSLLLRTHFGLKSLKMVHTRHGAGDREVGFDRASGKFDMVLVSGQKIADRLQRAGLLKPGGYRIVGYPKFDMHAGTARPKLFDNDRPTVLYNPHCSPRLSSWYRDGLAVLEAFYQSDKYNLIFAPHVMLFSKRVQVSLDRLRLDWPGRIPERYRNCAHMLIDTGSANSCNMSYTRAADLYLGDASSQVYEFLLDPRPCAFLDSHDTDWREDNNYQHWHAGPVLGSAQHLEASIDEVFATHADYLPVQRRLFEYSFDLNGTPSAQRAAEAIECFAATQLATRSAAVAVSPAY